MIKDTEARVELDNSCFKTGDIITIAGVKRFHPDRFEEETGIKLEEVKV